MTRKHLAYCIGIAALVILAGVAGNSDYEEAKREAEAYCANVHSGLWPDYNGTYAEYCKNGEYNGK